MRDSLFIWETQLSSLKLVRLNYLKSADAALSPIAVQKKIKNTKKNKVVESAARNKAAHSSFLRFCCYLTRWNIIIQRNHDGKTTYVLQTVLLLLLFLA